MYPEDFYDPQNDFAMTTNLLEFGHRHRLSDLRAKTRKNREHFKRIQTDGGLVGKINYIIFYGFSSTTILGSIGLCIWV